MSKVLLDTNLLIYASDPRDPAKRDRAISLIRQHMTAGSGVVSTQVLQEYACVALTRLKLQPPVVLRQLTLLEQFEVVVTMPEMVRRAVELHALHKISYWDALIIAAAEHAGCETIFSEDLNAGQLYSGVVLVNPFDPDSQGA